MQKNNTTNILSKSIINITNKHTILNILDNINLDDCWCDMKRYKCIVNKTKLTIVKYIFNYLQSSIKKISSTSKIISLKIISNKIKFFNIPNNVRQMHIKFYGDKFIKIPHKLTFFVM